MMGDVAKDSRQTFMKGTGVNNNGVSASSMHQHYNRSTNSTDQFQMIPRVNHYDISPYTNKIVSYCDAADPVCNSGDDWTAHWQYMDRYKVNAASFALSKLGRVGANHELFTKAMTPGSS